MQSLLIKELLNLFFHKCGNCPETFVSHFNNSNFLIGYNYQCQENRFTDVSNSFKTILGYSPKNILDDEVFFTKIVHHADRSIVKEYLDTSTVNKRVQDQDSTTFSSHCLKMQAYNITGYWRLLFLNGMNYLNLKNNSLNKIGLFVKQSRRKCPEKSELSQLLSVPEQNTPLEEIINLRDKKSFKSARKAFKEW